MPPGLGAKSLFSGEIFTGSAMESCQPAVQPACTIYRILGRFFTLNMEMVAREWERLFSAELNGSGPENAVCCTGKTGHARGSESGRNGGARAAKPLRQPARHLARG